MPTLKTPGFSSPKCIFLLDLGRDLIETRQSVENFENFQRCSNYFASLEPVCLGYHQTNIMLGGGILYIY